jgi:hypothetical protein
VRLVMLDLKPAANGSTILVQFRDDLCPVRPAGSKVGGSLGLWRVHAACSRESRWVAEFRTNVVNPRAEMTWDRKRLALGICSYF